MTSAWDRLVERHEALSQSVELLTKDVRELGQQVGDLGKYVGEIAEGTARVAALETSIARYVVRRTKLGPVGPKGESW